MLGRWYVYHVNIFVCPVSMLMSAHNRSTAQMRLIEMTFTSQAFCQILDTFWPDETLWVRVRVSVYSIVVETVQFPPQLVQKEVSTACTLCPVWTINVCTTFHSKQSIFIEIFYRHFHPERYTDSMARIELLNPLFFNYPVALFLSSAVKCDYINNMYSTKAIVTTNYWMWFKEKKLVFFIPQKVHLVQTVMPCC